MHCHSIHALLLTMPEPRLVFVLDLQQSQACSATDKDTIKWKVEL